MTGRADLGGQVHDLAHLFGHDFTERSAEDGEVLGEDEDLAAVDRAVAGDHGVAPRTALGHVEVGGAVPDESVEFLERAGVEQDIEAFAGGQLAFGVVLLDRLFRSGVDGLLHAAHAGSRASLGGSRGSSRAWTGQSIWDSP